MILFVNACVRKDSRTRKLADYLLDRMDGPVEEIRLERACFPSTDETFLAKRDRFVRERVFSDPIFAYAKQFACADEIVIAAPYWDLSFPASLKQYIEQINVVGLTFRYTPDGVPEGLCNARRLFYVSTAGGAFVPKEYGFGYIRALAETFYGIPDVRLIEAAGLDVEGTDTEAVLRDAFRRIDEICG